MELNNIELTVTDADLSALVGKYAPGDEAPVSDLAAMIDERGVIVSGKFQVAVLKGSFEATVALRGEGQMVMATLAEVKALGPVGNMFKGTLMGMLQKKLADVPGVSGDEDAIKVDLADLLASRGITASVGELVISCAPGRLTLKLSGELGCAG